MRTTQAWRILALIMASTVVASADVAPAKTQKSFTIECSDFRGVVVPYDQASSKWSVHENGMSNYLFRLTLFEGAPIAKWEAIPNASGKAHGLTARFSAVLTELAVDAEQRTFAGEEDTRLPILVTLFPGMLVAYTRHGVDSLGDPKIESFYARCKRK